MLGKLLVTAVVILLAFILIRQKGLKSGLENGLLSHEGGRATHGEKKQGVNKDDKRSALQKDLRLGAYLFLILMTGLGGALYYYSWQDDHTIITVNLVRDGQQEPVSYEVYKYQLGDRSFTTIDGISVTVAASERMEIVGLND